LVFDKASCDNFEKKKLQDWTNLWVLNFGIRERESETVKWEKLLDLLLYIEMVQIAYSELIFGF